MKKLYIVAVKYECGTEIFEFKTKKARDQFIKDNKDKDYEYATSEIIL